MLFNKLFNSDDKNESHLHTHGRIQLKRPLRRINSQSLESRVPEYKCKIERERFSLSNTSSSRRHLDFGETAKRYWYALK